MERKGSNPNIADRPMSLLPFRPLRTFLVPMESIETEFIVTTKKGRKFTFSFTDDYSLHQFIKRQSIKIGDISFLRVKNTESDYHYSDEVLVNVDFISVIECNHEFSEAD
jgi:hypothetical protein